MADQHSKELPSKYNPHGIEDKWYPIWEKEGLFSWKKQLTGNDQSASGETLKKKYGSFSIVIPPPNVTGSLHLGHALNHTVQDILTRYHRMKGKLSLWLPGTDHAGIATQNVVEKLLAKEDKRRWDLGREKFEERVWQWKEESGGMITHQQRQLGESVDWSYERFTMDEGLSKSVKKVFVSLYNEKLIYRGERIINWCVRCTTALSNIEVEHRDRKGKLYHVKYALADKSGFLEVATTRPETMLGDEALAVHPDDERYSKFVGKKVVLPLVEKEIPIVADNYVDKDFGTGVVKITPAHDANDFEVGRRHNLPITRILDDHGVINNLAPKKYQGLSREKARKVIVEDLQDSELLIKVEEHAHSVGECYRCQSIIEPLTSKQWFVKIKPLAKEAIRVVEDKEIKFVPQRWEKTYFDWMYNIQDWCISRQLWWGHRIPAYYCSDCSEVTVAEDEVTTCSHCGSHNVKQDEDVLDTWFSSALWPFSTLYPKEHDIPSGAWPKDSIEQELFYPTSVLVTGFDIIFFWVARMIMMGLHFRKQIPFDTVYIHGLVRDATRQKMSKSKGNVVNPLEKMDEYGTDAFRFFLISILPEGKDIIYDESRLKGYSAFCNKIWNTARFIWMNQPSDYILASEAPQEASAADYWIVEKFNECLKTAEEAIATYRFADYATAIYDFIWKNFCDNYLELSKTSLKDEKTKQTSLYFLNKIFLESLRLLHPLMPFITEELYSFWVKDGRLGNESWAKAISLEPNQSKVASVENLLHLIYKVRNIRGELKLPPGEKYQACIVIEDDLIRSQLEKMTLHIEALAKLKPISFSCENQSAKGLRAILDFGSVSIDASSGINIEKELQRINKEKANIEKAKTSLEKRLDNDNFVSNAPPEVITSERERLKQFTSKLKELNDLSASLG